MKREIVRDVVFLQKPAEEATPLDLGIGRDLLDTLAAHRETCVGLAANMIGFPKRIIVVNMGMVDLLMFNPVLIGRSKPYPAKESCLSLDGVRSTKRYGEIQLEYRDEKWEKQTVTLRDFPAQICQHELDHLEGILI